MARTIARPRSGLLLAGMVLSLGLGLAACGGGGPGEKAKAAPAKPPRVETIVAGAGADGGRLRASGMVAYQREASLSFRTPGLVRQILVDDGDIVRRGQTLAQLDLQDLNAAVTEAQLGLRNAELQLERDQALLARGFIAQARVDASELARARAQAALTAVQFNRNQAVIVAPDDGVVLRRLAEPNQNVPAGAPVFLFGARGQGLIVRAGVAEDALRRIKVGDRADVRVAGGAFQSGAVMRIGAKSDALTAAFDVEVKLNDPTGLRSGQVAEVLIGARGAIASANKVKAPSTALLDARADQGVVYVVGPNGVVARRAVRTAGLEGEDVVIAEGVAPGERLVVSGAAFIRDGQTVEAVDRPVAP